MLAKQLERSKRRIGQPLLLRRFQERFDMPAALRRDQPKFAQMRPDRVNCLRLLAHYSNFEQFEMGANGSSPLRTETHCDSEIALKQGAIAA